MSVLKKLSLYLLGLGLMFAPLGLKADNSVGDEKQSYNLIEKDRCCKVTRGATGATGATGIGSGVTGITGATGVSAVPAYSSFYSLTPNVYGTSDGLLFDTTGPSNGAVLMTIDPVADDSVFTVQVAGTYSVSFGFNVFPGDEGLGFGDLGIFLNGVAVPIGTIELETDAVSNDGYLDAVILLGLNVNDVVTIVYTDNTNPPLGTPITVGTVANELAAWINFIKIAELPI